MMRKRISGTGLFLLELLIVILFFSLAATVCVRLFAAAKLKSSFSDNMGAASARAESAAECFKAAHGDTAEAAALFGAEMDGHGFTAYYDSQWQPCAAEDAAFTLTLEADGTDAHISAVGTDGTEYFAIDAVALLCAEGGAV